MLTTRLSLPILGRLNPSQVLASSHKLLWAQALRPHSLRAVSTVVPTPTTCPLASAAPSADTHCSPETKRLVALLRDQNRYFATVKIRGRHFTVTEGDTIVTDRMADLELGDVLELDCVTELGSKDYTVVGKPYVSPKYFTIRAVVMEHPVSSTVTVVKFKKRKDYKKTIHYSPRYTLLRIAKLDVNKL
ncbi:hypothetical protein IWQ61_010186 [Dispira simplex]|nr:hypothetical protein IWQ61_010186 [Dispira simplex]